MVLAIGLGVVGLILLIVTLVEARRSGSLSDPGFRANLVTVAVLLIVSVGLTFA